MTKTLEEVCERNNGLFHERQEQKDYCMLTNEVEVDCFYRSDQPDDKGCYKCENPLYTKLEIYDGVGHA